MGRRSAGRWGPPGQPLRPIHHYCLATGTWFAAHGVQSVLFAYLVTMTLRETPQLVGVAQMAMLMPAMLLMLFAGSVADALGGRRVALVAQSCAVLPSLGLLALLWLDALSFPAMLGYALAMGCAIAFVTPARDGLLNQVAEGRVQRTVVVVSLAQFGVQTVGFLVAGLAAVIGPAAVMAFQATVLALGVFAYRQLPAPPPLAISAPRFGELARAVAEGCGTVLRSAAMRSVVVQNIAMGVCFMGSYIVSMPLLIREVYAGSSVDLALVNAANMAGIVTSILWLLHVGDVRRQGRALLLAHGFGCVFLAATGWAAHGHALEFWAVAVCVYLWGACGGVAMSMSRTIMQEAAPEGQRGRVMAFFSFSFMGAGPLGALLCGQLVAVLGAPAALMVASTVLMVVIVAAARASPLWNMAAARSVPDRARRHA